MKPLFCSRRLPIGGLDRDLAPATRSQTAGVWAVPGGVNRQNVAGFTAA